jgi:predicted amidophosphoribosyltransferase
MKKNSKAIFQTLSDFIFPLHCYGCEIPLEFYEKYLCLNCQIQLPLTLFHQTTENPLFQKLSIRFPTASATSLFYFEKDGVLAHLIHLFKYNRVKEIGSFLGAWLGDHLKESTVKE